MPIAKREGGAGFDPVPAGVHQAVCYSVVDLGTQPSFNPKFPARRKVLLSWEIPGEVINVEGENKPRAISKDYTLSLGKKATLRAMLESWRGRKFTDAELDGFDLKNVLGCNCLINVVHEPGAKDASKVYARVDSVMPLTKGMPPVAAKNPKVLFDLPETGRIAFPKEIPEWVATRIQQSEEYKARVADPATTVDTSPEHAPDDDKPF